MAQLPPVSRVVRLDRYRAIPVNPVDLRRLHRLLLASIALGILNLVFTLSR